MGDDGARAPPLEFDARKILQPFFVSTIGLSRTDCCYCGRLLQKTLVIFVFADPTPDGFHFWMTLSPRTSEPVRLCPLEQNSGDATARWQSCDASADLVDWARSYPLSLHSSSQSTHSAPRCTARFSGAARGGKLLPLWVYGKIGSQLIC